MESPPTRGTFARAWNIAVRTRGVFTHRAGFQKLACAKRGLVRTGQHLGGRAWCARRVNYSQASSEPTTSPAPETTRQSNQQPRQHHTPTRINHITSTKSHAPIKPAAPATSHTNPHQPHLQHQKLRANQASSPGNTTHQPAATAAPTPEATHQPHHQRQNRASTTPPVMAEPHLQQQKPRANRITTIGNTTRQPPHQRRLHQRFLYCDGETPNISLKYFAKYFCVPKPTASETSTTLSPASADNSWAALLSRMVRMNTEGFIP